jgi:hypothetical protein
MDTPITGFPGFVNELSEEYRIIFKQKRSFDQFKRCITGLILSRHPTIASINGMFIEHTDQSNLNRFVTGNSWSEYQLNKTKIHMINQVEPDGIVILDDFITEKFGENIYGTDYHFDHSKGRNVFGHSIVDCVLSGKGIFPLLSSIYLREKSRWRDSRKHLTKIDIQIRHLTQLVDMGLKFNYVTFDCWYFCKKLTDHIESLGKDWVGQVKSNRLIWVDDKWISVKEYAERIFPDRSFKTAKIDVDTYLVKAVTVIMKNMGPVRLLISNNDRGNFHFYATNRIEWNEAKVLKVYCRRWDIEVWHREGKVDYGLKDCQLRSDGGVSKYLTLSSCADTFLEIVTLLSPLLGALRKRVGTPGLKHHFVHLELLKDLISFIQSKGKKSYECILGAILYPYKSTKVKRINLV